MRVEGCTNIFFQKYKIKWIKKFIKNKNRKRNDNLFSIN